MIYGLLEGVCFLWCNFDLSGGYLFVLVGVISCEVIQVYGYILLNLG